MEFRLFLPIRNVDEQWMSVHDANCYDNLLKSLQEHVNSQLGSAGSEKRCDDYFVGNDHLGIKNRVIDKIS